MSHQLKIEIQSYWHPGTGRGQGSDVDAIAHRDKYGIPCLPGRTVKGLLRDAVNRWAQFEDNKESNEKTLAEQLFGKLPESADTAETDSLQAMAGFGLLRISDATLPDAERYFLQEEPELSAGLFRSLHATKINHDTGTATNQSLRGIEVVVPLTLYAEISEVPGVEMVERWVEKMKPSLSLIQAVGANRTRGLGRAVVTLEEKA